MRAAAPLLLLLLPLLLTGVLPLSAADVFVVGFLSTTTSSSSSSSSYRSTRRRRVVSPPPGGAGAGGTIVVVFGGGLSSSSTTNDGGRRDVVETEMIVVVVVVGKIILDVYGDPAARDGDGDDADNARVTIGGGGPQAAWGACASLAARDAWRRKKGRRGRAAAPAPPPRDDPPSLPPPPRQGVTFLAPIGLRNWTPSLTDELETLLPMLATPPILVSSRDHATPTIYIWHDADEVVRWTPIDDSFGNDGADGLWRDRPSARDILDATGGDDGGDIDLLHAILESGRDSAGNGLDASPFFDPSLMARVRAASVEPIVFPDDETGIVSREDVDEVISLVDRVEASLFAARRGTGDDDDDDDRLLVISPDRPCYDALVSRRAEYRHRHTRGDDDDDDARGRRRIEFAIRDGSRGSVVDGTTIPPATLIVPDIDDDDDGRPINPTGAGNAYAGAYAACRATGSDLAEAACIANAVGAVVCEYEHLPPWTWESIDRIVEAASEVEGKIRMGGRGLD